MSRFLVVSFAGLALAFYELSGGADFSPPERPQTESPSARVAAASDRGRIISRPAETQLASPVLTPYSAPAVIKTATGNRADTASDTPTGSDAAVINISLREPASVVSLPQPISLNLPITGLRIGSIEGGLGAITTDESQPVAAVATPEPIGDVRKIRASRANVRLGPGTRFPVLMQLLAGDKVRVLNDDPSGWSLLENPKTGQVGWIAASLLSAKQS
ncbi:SH3 domain-containing protein [Tritonibacter mobilis]|uniref:SH3 domain-containing protein n=1 Tax=Tritonibacter mobilis TaxID=379347 RepID=UPI000806CFC2|nr:SH3 domain-containing protein [Tritonibacter mobilis]